MLVASKMSAATALTAGILGLTIDVVADGDDVCEIVFGRAVPSFSREENRSVFYDALSIEAALLDYEMSNVAHEAVIDETHKRLTLALRSFLENPDCGRAEAPARDLSEELEKCLRDVLILCSRASVTETPGATSHDLATRYLGLSSRLTETEKTDYMMTWARGRNVPVERFVRA